MHLDRSVCFQFGDAPLVIGMMMRDQDALQRQIVGFQTGDDRGGIAGIDNEGTLAAGQQPDVIVFECRNE